ncbi:MAG: UDP-diphospho-muramoylpentapeptide beta-N- acetylglucosaminyltransferase [Candidatus Falkowbacteria bacterium GW2011_GWC2_38_22]|uniref:UDP-N-acetylglucosamine--N-acetylmuramyl-(pentapeptide) pyrophosphoryl-undecaprenol N-acetylglucosamine transferase n=1 Tax=Candidatus Falkowbacteria bacterium GW2011_GWE1_38_31 TaxID=1618638 RepID=A0A0G0JVQ6_9BACT|nr:MAG: UDP-diphospho-muramoylpentapeptide beta-N- acetylglucosaminyltransferase [Candidatus Falkowbacteria bacterium GW2011_GWF2_38_1205]KKQ61991.1 MAG: UDP-diphospho-muramoylpentapeptide beta-N- acetylglucosaminyltransferase [Candidatus Falkowbacteria bacterium GW2011_GWC2_38_22]KKQ63847.1 MAG: UDP-diphospho-muramoylpentapeptide beta-N- acetylglucosaminyltransferase [Candidatus Falkowbacteria bacterium GW2011_GWF1_38_22]KKQ66104.1 MAG: UDP-diphospho-muramoylpentapeptide beta-N- acetylglucosami
MNYKMMSNQISKKIILTGGGTGGSVTPLLAISEILGNIQYSIFNIQYLWIGTKTGIERQMAESAGIEYRAIFSGKLRRYWSWQNVVDIFKIKIAFFQSLFILINEKPDLIISAGSFVSVPLVWAAWILRIPVLIQQLDVRPGLANKLMAPFAKKVMVTFEKSLTDYGDKAVLVGNPIRKEFTSVKISKREAMQKIGLRDNKPVVLVMGGGTGAGAINELVIKSIDSLTKVCQILHITGKGKAGLPMMRAMETNIYYKYFEFLDVFGLIKNYSAADIIISRAGIGSLTELSYVAKPTIIIPMPDSHQEDNSAVFAKADAAIVLNQNELTGEILLNNIKMILNDEILRNRLKNNIKTVIKTDCEEKIVEIISKLLS